MVSCQISYISFWRLDGIPWFNCWQDHLGAVWTITDFSVAPDIVAAAVTQSFFDARLQRASTHYNGKGMDKGIDIDSTLRYIRNIKSDKTNDISYQYKACLETVIVAGCWPAARIALCSPSHPTVCARCGQSSEDCLHVFWTCPCNRDFTHEDVT